MNKIKKVLLIVRDGWGYSADTRHNMIAQADTPYTDMIEEKYPTFLLEASGEAVGLPDGKFGNSEVGHMTLGAGRALEQSLLRINHAISDKSFFEKEVFLKASHFAKKNNGKFHIIGLLQKEGVHASFDHIFALVEFAKKEAFEKSDVCIHIVTDGRDAPKQNALDYIKEFQEKISKLGVGEIVSFAGRYFAMDRNKNWERTEKYYKTLYADTDKKFSSAQELFQEKYSDQEFSDEFLEGVISENFSGIQDGDSIVFANFRKDRARQLSQVFSSEDFSEFKRDDKNIFFVAMTNYFDGLGNVAFPDFDVENTLGEILERNNKTQLRIAETEKYAHVTFFFDGGQDKNFHGEKKILVPSPDVKTFDLKPEMAAYEITEKLLSELDDAQQDFILCNYANADMVGHSGDHGATKKAVACVDEQVSKIIPKALELGYSIILTADHGNAEHKHGTYETSHTTSLVQSTFINCDLEDDFNPKSLADISSVVLKNLDLE